MAALVRSPDAGVFAALRDEALFRRVGIVWGALTWPGDLDLDLAPDAMYDEIKRSGVWVLR